nr:MAG TPA: hypothetical protein [Bacteriophage sp.]
MFSVKRIRIRNISERNVSGKLRPRCMFQCNIGFSGEIRWNS